MAVPISGLQKWRGIALALCIGSVGGLVFFKLSLPLPWMLGSMIFTVVAAMLGARLRRPDMMRSPFRSSGFLRPCGTAYLQVCTASAIC